MMKYGFELALHGLRRFPRTSALVVLTVAIGLAASMTTLTLLHALSADPLPGRSQHLYLAWVDTLQRKAAASDVPDGVQLTDYKRIKMPDADALLAGHQAVRQAAVASVYDGNLQGEGGRSSGEYMLATSSDFISMFGVPLRAGRGWTADEDTSRAPVAVIDSTLAQALFGTDDAVGRQVLIKGHPFHVIGVSAPFTPQPHFYALGSWTFSGSTRDSVFLPYTTALDAGLVNGMPDGCDDSISHGKPVFQLDPLHCAWLSYWVQLETPAQASAYRRYLDSYVAQQKSLGAIAKPARSQLYSVQQWLTMQNVIPDNVRLNVWLAGSFLLLCMVNVAGLLAAKFLRRSAEIGIRRALGAPRRAVFLQHVLEATLVCALGGVLALPLTASGLWLLRLQDEGFTDLAKLDALMFCALFVLALAVGVLVGWLPAWRASRVEPGLQVKSA